MKTRLGRKPLREALVAALLVVPAALQAQVADSASIRSGPLFDQLAQMDSILFEATFVACDAGTANAIFSEDVEFFHDQTGLASGDRVRENTARLIESCPREQGVSRILVAESVEVHPIAGYGAIQMGVHRFEERGAALRTVARFVHVWRHKAGEWKLARVLSFDHRTEPAGGASRGADDSAPDPAADRT